MFDWFQRHKLFGLILMSILLVTMGVSVAMIQVMSEWGAKQGRGDVAFTAYGRDFSIGEIDEMRDIVALGSRVTGNPSLVTAYGPSGDSRSDSRGVDLREAVVRAILLERATRSGLSAGASEVETQIETLKEINEKGVERNLAASRRTWDDIRAYFRDELTIRKLLIYESLALGVDKESAYQEFSDQQNGGTQYAWVELSLAETRKQVEADLDKHLRDFYEKQRGLMQTPYRLAAEWVVARVDREHGEEAIQAFHAASEDPEIRDQPLDDVRDQVVTKLIQRARERADQAITSLGTVFDEEGMATAPLDQVLARFYEKTEGAYDDLLENSSTGGLVEEPDLPEEMKQCGLAFRVRGVDAEGGIVRKMVGNEPGVGIVHYVLARTQGREDSRPMSFEELRANGFARLLEVFYDTTPGIYTPAEKRLVDFALADYAHFASVGQVEESELRSFYNLYKNDLWSEGEGEVKPFEQVSGQVLELVRKRDAISLARTALEDLKSQAESLGGTVQLLELAADSPVTVIRAEVEAGDSYLDKVTGFEKYDQDDRNRIYFAGQSLSATDIEDGTVSTITDLGTFSVMAKVVKLTKGERRPLDDGLRPRLLEDFITSKTLEVFRERGQNLSQRMSLRQVGAEEPDSWSDEEKQKWRHDNRTRFEKIATEEGLTIKKTEEFYKDSDIKVEFLSDLPLFDRRRRGITLDRVQIVPNLPLQPRDVAGRDIYCLVTAYATRGIPREEATVEQLEQAKSSLVREQQIELGENLFKLTWLEKQAGVAYEAKGKEFQGIDLSPELAEKKKPAPRSTQQTISFPQ